MTFLRSFNRSTQSRALISAVVTFVLLSRLPAAGQDVRSYGVVKGQGFFQTNTGPGFLDGGLSPPCSARLNQAGHLGPRKNRRPQKRQRRGERTHLDRERPGRGMDEPVVSTLEVYVKARFVAPGKDRAKLIAQVMFFSKNNQQGFESSHPGTSSDLMLVTGGV